MDCLRVILSHDDRSGLKCLDKESKNDHRSHMITNLKSAKAHLSDLVEKASSGEEIWVTVRGEPKARICPIPSGASDEGKSAWLASVQETRAKYGRSRVSGNVQTLWDELRGDTELRYHRYR